MKNSHKKGNFILQNINVSISHQVWHFNALVSPAACVLLVNTGRPANQVIDLALCHYAGQLWGND